MSDKAERLHSLVSKLKHALGEIELVGVHKSHISEQPLWKTFEPIAHELNLSSYAELRDQFISLCNGIRSEVAVISLRKESVRVSWLECLDTLSGIFDAGNFGKPTISVFQVHFSNRNLEVLDSISERLQNENSFESSEEELAEALGAIRDVICVLESSGELDKRITAILKHYLQQMEVVYAQSSDFGEDIFWQLYKETFATFVQIHPVIAGIKEIDEFKSKFNIAMTKLTEKSLFGLSVAANIATIGSSVVPLITG